jgi:hypothetical protein
MKKLLICSMMLVRFLTLASTPPQLVEAQQKPIPSYAKWGRFAMEQTAKKYPQAQIRDYLHIGKVTGAETSTEKFKLWLRENQKEFGVFIDIEFDNKTEKVVRVNFKESPR